MADRLARHRILPQLHPKRKATERDSDRGDPSHGSAATPPAGRTYIKAATEFADELDVPDELEVTASDTLAANTVCNSLWADAQISDRAGTSEPSLAAGTPDQPLRST